MSCYDEVHFRCPKCLNKLAIQSKGGPCSLNRYSAYNCPAAVATYLQGEIIKCSGCGRVWKVAELPRVELKLTPVVGEDEEEYD